MMKIVSEICKTEELAVDACVATLNPGGACLQFTQHCRFAGYERKTIFLAQSLLALVEVFA